eukprot:scaffold204060_cov24-Tisochrysis_lutea.AAC.1
MGGWGGHFERCSFQYPPSSLALGDILNTRVCPACALGVAGVPRCPLVVRLRLPTAHMLKSVGCRL